MDASSGESVVLQRQRARAFSLLELLIVIGITALVLSILLPSLSAARESANIAKCLANMRQIGASALMYMEDAGAPTQPWHLGFQYNGADIERLSEYVYGGFQVDRVHPILGQKVDVRKVQTHERPYNRYLAPMMCEGPVMTYMCPSDSFTLTAFADDPCAVPVLTANAPTWSLNGNSYSINWNWLASPPWSNKAGIYQDLGKMSAGGRELLRDKIGRHASEFVLTMEGPMNALMQDARPSDGSYGQSCLQQLRMGWHKRYSRYSVSFLDGHAEHRFIDTRFSRADGYDLWAEPYTSRGY
ncbi:MAG: type II secretion system protein [Phycisphaerae bacterium]|nr:type II secretion system protein [Phycisphaerae bacterium]